MASAKMPIRTGRCNKTTASLLLRATLPLHNPQNTSTNKDGSTMASTATVSLINDCLSPFSQPPVPPRFSFSLLSYTPVSRAPVAVYQISELLYLDPLAPLLLLDHKFSSNSYSFSFQFGSFLARFRCLRTICRLLYVVAENAGWSVVIRTQNEVEASKMNARASQEVHKEEALSFGA